MKNPREHFEYAPRQDLSLKLCIHSIAPLPDVSSCKHIESLTHFSLPASHSPPARFRSVRTTSPPPCVGKQCKAEMISITYSSDSFQLSSLQPTHAPEHIFGLWKSFRIISKYIIVRVSSNSNGKHLLIEIWTFKYVQMTYNCIKLCGVHFRSSSILCPATLI